MLLYLHVCAGARSGRVRPRSREEDHGVFCFHSLSRHPTAEVESSWLLHSSYIGDDVRHTRHSCLPREHPKPPNIDFGSWGKVPFGLDVQRVPELPLPSGLLSFQLTLSKISLYARSANICALGKLKFLFFRSGGCLGVELSWILGAIPEYRER